MSIRLIPEDVPFLEYDGHISAAGCIAAFFTFDRASTYPSEFRCARYWIDV
jgi:hypothetical protein